MVLHWLRAALPFSIFGLFERWLPVDAHRAVYTSETAGRVFAWATRAFSVAPHVEFVQTTGSAAHTRHHLQRTR